jgi:voltage-gated potassium channel
LNLQKKLYILLEEPSTNKAAYWLNIFIYLLIIISILSLMLQSVASYNAKYGHILETINNVIMQFFIVEYIARLYASGAAAPYRGLKGKVRYIFSPYAIIDLLAIAPYILMGFDIDNSFIRALRLLRVFRLFRMRKYARFLHTLREIIYDKKEEFSVLFVYTIIILVMLAFVIYGIEHEAQPDVFSNIPQTLWWAVATLTTVGYGDMYPITAEGKFITAVISLLGIGFVAIPGGILASEFTERLQEQKEKECKLHACPKCCSEKIELYENPKVIVAGKEKSFGKLYHCKSCDFEWLE